MTTANLDQLELTARTAELLTQVQNYSTRCSIFAGQAARAQQALQDSEALRASQVIERDQKIEAMTKRCAELERLLKENGVDIPSPEGLPKPIKALTQEPKKLN